MRAISGMVWLLVAAAIGYYIYSAQIRPSPNGTPLAQQTDFVAVRGDLLSLAQSERLYLATSGSYATLDQLRQSGNMNHIPENRRGYVYVLETDGVAHFRITAKPADPTKTDLPTLSIDETMQITQ